MSSVYNLEPPTAGKVLLKTSHGDIEIELWSKEAPKAVRNFVQLCLEGYYDNTIFHRIIPGLVVQGGDPTGTGLGGDSIYNAPFKDEFHSRLRFSHRGLVACANPNLPDANGSQFFITLDRADGLNRKHTIFGRIAGDTMYNVAAMGELEVDDDDRPLHPPVLHSVEVLWNPFSDIKPRITAEQRRAAAEEDAKRRAAAEKAKRPNKKNATLLSFGEEAEEEDTVYAAAPKIKSAHDAIDDQQLAKQYAADLAAYAELNKSTQRDAPATTNTPGDDGSQGGSPSDTEEQEGGPGDAAAAARAVLKRKRGGGGGGERGVSFQERLQQRLKHAKEQRSLRFDVDREAARAPSTAAADGDAAAADDDGNEQGDHEEEEEGGAMLTEGRRDAILASTKARSAVVVPSKQIRIHDAELLSDWQKRRAEYKARKRLGGAREKDTMKKLSLFTAKLRNNSGGGGGGREPPPQDTNNNNNQGYDGKVDPNIDHTLLKPAAWRVDEYLREEEEGEGGGLGLEDLRAHKLQFVKAKDAMARRDDVDDYVVVDPLANKGKSFNKQDAKVKKRTTEWAGGAIA